MPSATPGENHQAQQNAHQREEAEIRHRDQPHKVPAHPVKLIRIERVFAQDERPDLKESRDESAPGRQDEETDEPQPCRARIRIAGRRADRAGLLAGSSGIEHQHSPIGTGNRVVGHCIMGGGVDRVKPAGQGSWCTRQGKVE